MYEFTKSFLNGMYDICLIEKKFYKCEFKLGMIVNICNPRS